MATASRVTPPLVPGALLDDPDRAVEALAGVLGGRRLAVLTGAGCSTESGIPDYRGPETARRARNPIEGRAFVQSAAARRRYWARSFVGWARLAAARPNPAHRALAELEARGGAVGVVTQNVDGLHRRAGSRRVIELHGRLADVVCLGCGRVEARQALQGRLAALNPGFDAGLLEAAPDGDAEVEGGAEAGFRVPDCPACGGVLKPGVVFFGESVPRAVVDAAFALVEAAEALLVVGSSLAVYSGLRFVRRAFETGRPVAILNVGETRGDRFAAVRAQGRAGEVLPRLVRTLTP